MPNKEKRRNHVKRPRQEKKLEARQELKLAKTNKAVL